MADETTILEYIVRAQDEARGLLQQQVTVIERLSAAVIALTANQQKQVAQAQASARAAVQQGDSLDKLIKLHDGVQKATQRTIQGFQAMSGAMQAGSKITLVQSAWLTDLNKAVQANSGFMAQNGTQWNTLMGHMQVGSQITPRMIGQFNQLGKEFQNSATGANSAGLTIKNVGAAAVGASAALGGLAATVGNNLVGALQESVKQASLFQNTFIGLSTIAKSFGQNVNDTTDAARTLASDGLMSVRESAAGLKNLLAAGFGLPEAINLMKGFKDIAAFNRQASMEFGYAIVSATEGIKNQNSLLVDNAGLTKNLTIILKEMGLSEQDLSKIQTDVNIRTKFYNGLLKEMSMASGDASRMTETFSGSQTALQVQIQLLQVAIGEKLLPVLAAFNRQMTEIVSFFRTGNSGWAEMARLVATAATAFIAISAALVTVAGLFGALVGAITLLTPLLDLVGIGLGTLALGFGGVAGALAIAATAFIAWKTHSSDATAAMEETNKKTLEQRDSLGKLAQAFVDLRQAAGKDAGKIKFGGSDAGSVEFTQLVNKLREEFPKLNIDVKDLDTTIGGLQKRVTDLNDTFNKNNETVLRAKLEAQGFKGTIAEMQTQIDRQMNGVKENTTVWQDLGTYIGGGFKGLWNGLMTDFGRAVGVIKSVSTEIGNLFTAMQNLPGMKSVTGFLDGVLAGFDKQVAAAKAALKDAAGKGTDTTQAQADLDALQKQVDASKAAAKAAADVKKAQDDAAASVRRYGELIKGQISTTESYGEAQKKLAADIKIAMDNGMNRNAAMRLPEIVKQSKELMSAFREGVAPVDKNASAIEQLGKSIERTRRLQQEEADHQLEYGNRVRALTRAYIDQTTGVDSLASRSKLLSQVMDHFHVGFDSSADSLMPFQGLMQQIVNDVEKLGKAAPANFEKLRTALLRLPGGESPLANLTREATLKGNEFVQKVLDDQNKLALKMAADELQIRERVAAESIRIHDEMLQAEESSEVDSLEKRLRVIERETMEKMRNINPFQRGTTGANGIINSVEFSSQVADVFKLHDAQVKAAAILWKKEFLGPTQADLQTFADQAVASFEEARSSSDYTADAVRKAWLNAYAALMAADKTRARAIWAATGEVLDQLVSQFQQLSQIAGEGGLATATQEIANMAGALSLAYKGMDSLERGLASFGKGQTAQGIIDTTAAITQMAGAMMQATNHASRTKNAIGGATTGAMIGANPMLVAATGGMSIIGGAVIGGIIGALRKPEWAKAKDQIARDLGMAVSDAVAKGIADTEKSLGVNRGQAIALNLSALMKENGGAVTGFSKEIDTLFGLIAKGGKNSQAAIAELGNTFGIMVEQMNTGMNGMADQAMLNFIKRVKESGVEVKAVSDFLSAMVDSASEGLNKVVNGIIGGAVANFGKLDEMTDKTLPDLLKKQEDLLDKMSKEKDPRALTQMQREYQKLQEEIQKTFDDADKLSQGLTDFTGNGQDAFDRVGRLIGVTFDAGLANGKSFIQMLDLIGPSLDNMSKGAEEFGLTMDSSLQRLLGLRDVVNNNRELADSIDGLNQLMKGLNNLGAISQDTFNDLGATADDMRVRLTNAGVSGDDSLKLMAPTLQTLWELQQRFGYQTDDVTQSLLDEAVAAGDVGKAHMSAQERMVAGIDKLTDHLDLLLEKFGVDVPKDAEAGAGVAAAATSGVGAAIETVNAQLSNNGWAQWGADAAAAGEVAYNATHAVSYGHSPGGLIDIQKRLDDLKKQWKEQGEAARGGLGDAEKYVLALNKVLHDLDRAGMNDFQRTIDDIDMRRQASIKSFLKEMEGAAQEMIDIGIAAINKTAEIDTSKAVWEERNKRAKEAAEKAKEYADALKEINNQLALETIGTDTLEQQFQQTLLSLSQTREKAIEDFKKTMEGAPQDMINQGIDNINKTFDIRVREAQKKEAKRVEDLAKEYAKTITDLYRELEDAQTAGITNTNDRSRRSLELSLQRRLQDLAASLGAESQQYQQQAAIIQAIYDQLFKNLATQQKDAMTGLMRELEDATMARSGNSFKQQERLLRIQLDRRLEDLAKSLGAETAEYQAQAAIVIQIYNEMFGALQDQQRAGLKDLNAELEDLIAAGLDDGTPEGAARAKERQLQLEHDRRMAQLRDQFGEESAAYREQAAVLEEIYRIKNERLTEEDAKAQRERMEETLRSFQNAYYDLQNSAITPGQEEQRRADLERLAKRVFEAQGRIDQIGKTSTVQPSTQEATGTLAADLTRQIAALQANEANAAQSKLDTLRLELVVYDDRGNELTSLQLQNVEEAMATGKIRVDARSISNKVR